MTFEEWFEKWWGERTDGPYKSINVESIARAAWEAALTHDPAKAHAEPVAFAQVLAVLAGDVGSDRVVSANYFSCSSINNCATNTDSFGDGTSESNTVRKVLLFAQFAKK